MHTVKFVDIVNVQAVSWQAFVSASQRVILFPESVCIICSGCAGLGGKTLPAAEFEHVNTMQFVGSGMSNGWKSLLAPSMYFAKSAIVAGEYKKISGIYVFSRRNRVALTGAIDASGTS